MTFMDRGVSISQEIKTWTKSIFLLARTAFLPGDGVLMTTDLKVLTRVSVVPHRSQHGVEFEQPFWYPWTLRGQAFSTKQKPWTVVHKIALEQRPP